MASRAKFGWGATAFSCRTKILPNMFAGELQRVKADRKGRDEVWNKREKKPDGARPR